MALELMFDLINAGVIERHDDMPHVIVILWVDL